MTKRVNVIYGNCKVLSLDGDEMFLCTERRTNWYLARDLAEVVSDNPLIIKLLFKPKGVGVKHDKYGLTKKENKCVESIILNMKESMHINLKKN